MRKRASDLVFRKFLTSVSAAAVCSGCSLLFHADASQCATNSDCASHGLLNHVCQAGTCVASTVDMDASMQNPDSSMSSMDSGGSNDSAQAIEAAPDTATPPPPANYCNTTTDCHGVSPHPEVACDVDRHQCIQLTTDECSYVAPQNWQTNLSTSGLNPIFIGAFATIPPNGPLNHPSYLNYSLALQEFANAGGIPAGGGNAPRLPIAVVCDDTQDPNVIMNHLVNDVHVPAVIAALSSTILHNTFSNTNLSQSDAGAPSVFFINPFGSNTTLVPPSLETNELLWSMLGSPADLAPAYAAFFPYIERYVRNPPSVDGMGQTIGNVDGGAARPLRVAAFTATSSQDLLDLQAAVRPVLTWNGRTYQQNLSDGNYLDVEIKDSTLSGADLNSVIIPELPAAVNQLIHFQPDIVVSFASEEFIRLMETYEASSGSNHPFYLLGVYNTDSTDVLTSWIGSSGTFSTDFKRSRMAGIAFASAANNSVLQDYDTTFLATYGQNDSQFLGAENYYDATYFTVYSLAGAGHLPEAIGANLVQGMARLVNPPGFGDARIVGQRDIPNVIVDLQAAGNKAISLTGTLGAPDFSLTTGSRVSPGDVYCFNKYPQGSAQQFAPYFAFDELRLVSGLPADAGALTLPDGGPLTGIDGGAPSLYGSFDCYSGMFP